MIRSLALALAAALALLTTSLCSADEDFPVIHNEPITVRILSGKNGQSLGHLHLTLIGGYDQHDLREQLFREEAITDARGQARLSHQLANLPWLQVWVNHKSLCQTKPRKAGFSVELIRRDGLSAPNRCGMAVVEDAPGIFTVFVNGKAKKESAELASDSAAAQISTQPAASEQKPTEEQAASPAPTPSAAAAAPAASTPPATALTNALPFQTAALSLPLAQAFASAKAPAQAPARHSTRRAAGRTSALRIPAAAHKATPGASKAKLPQVSCAAQPPAANVAAAAAPTPTPAAASASKPDKTAISASKTARARARALGISLDSQAAAPILAKSQSAKTPEKNPPDKTPANAANATPKAKPPAGVRPSIAKSE